VKPLAPAAASLAPTVVTGLLQVLMSEIAVCINYANVGDGKK
jgi:hypothetical protein